MLIFFLISFNIINKGDFLKIQDNQCNSILKIPGKPEVPVIRKLFTGDTNLIKIGFSYTETTLNKPIYPAQKPVVKGFPPSPFVINRNLYKADRFYPPSPYKIIYLGKQSGTPLYIFEFHPYLYNPSRNKMKIAKNYSYHLPVSPIHKQKGNNLLIITSENFIPSLRKYIYYKEMQGYGVYVVKVESIGADTLNIRNTIQTFNPDYLLLVGDVDIIPAFYGQGGLNTYDHYTDLYYGCLDADYIPDIIYGRISIRDTAQLNAVVDKIITYDTLGGNWRKKAYFMASNDGTYHSIAESTHIYSISEARSSGVECDSLFYYYNSGTPVDSAFNNGRSIAVYSGHGAETGWQGPPFSNSDIDNLIPHNRLSFIMSFACFTGDYSTNECMMEKWLRVPQKGGIFAFGSSTSSLWDEDDLLQRRLFDAVFTQGYTKFGSAINRGKLLFAQDYGGDTSDTRSYFEQYNLFGDATLPVHISDYPVIYTDIPPIIPDTTGTLKFKIWDTGGGIQGNAGIIQGTTLFTASSDSNGNIALPVSGKKIAPFTLFLTVNNHRTSVISGRFIPDAPYIIFNSFRGYSCVGVDTLYVSLKNWGSKSSINTYVYFSTDTTVANILVDSIYYGNLSPQSVIEKSIFIDIKTGHPDSIPVYLSIQDISHIWNDTFFISTPYSHIVYKDSSSYQKLSISTFATVSFPVYNKGNTITRNVSGALTINNSKIIMLKDNDAIGNLQPHQAKSLYFTMNTESLSIIDKVQGTLMVSYPPYKNTYTIEFIPIVTSTDTSFAYLHYNIVHNNLIFETVSGSGELEIETFDILGRCVKKEKYNILSGKRKWISNVSQIPSGIYFIRVNFNNNTILRSKFLKI